jgi:hypothetical protein
MLTLRCAHVFRRASVLSPGPETDKNIKTTVTVKQTGVRDAKAAYPKRVSFAMQIKFARRTYLSKLKHANSAIVSHFQRFASKHSNERARTFNCWSRAGPEAAFEEQVAGMWDGVAESRSRIVFHFRLVWQSLGPGDRAIPP